MMFDIGISLVSLFLTPLKLSNYFHDLRGSGFHQSYRIFFSLVIFTAATTRVGRQLPQLMFGSFYFWECQFLKWKDATSLKLLESNIEADIVLMEKLLKPYDKECMRMAMLKHEETFKEQVYELHRLYRIQKILMRKIEGNCRPSSRTKELWNAKMFKNSNRAHDRQQKSTLKLDLERPAEEYAAESNDDRGLDFMDESEIQLTLGPTSYNHGRKKPETPRTSDSGPSFSSSSTGSSHINKTSRGTQRTTTCSPGQGFCNGGLVVQVNPEMTLDCQVASKNDGEVEEQQRRERLKHPPWIFQVLSLNMT